MKYKKIVIGIDQSYTKTGISVCADNKLLMVKSINYKGIKSHPDKRKEVRRVLIRLIKKASKMALQTIIIMERIRTFNTAQTKGKKKGCFGGLNPNYIKITGALIGTIIDTAYESDIQVYSVDSRSWKSKIVGSSKARTTKDGKRDAKGDTIKYIQTLGFDLFIRTDRNGNDIYDDDAADSACIALYGFIPANQQKLLLEEC
jgi:hypothetical protein